MDNIQAVVIHNINVWATRFNVTVDAAELAAKCASGHLAGSTKAAPIIAVLHQVLRHRHSTALPDAVLATVAVISGVALAECCYAPVVNVSNELYLSRACAHIHLRASELSLADLTTVMTEYKQIMTGLMLQGIEARNKSRAA